MIEQLRGALLRGRPVPVEPERRSEWEHGRAALLLDRAARHKIDAALGIGDRTPLRRCIQLSGDIAATVHIGILTEASVDQGLDAAQAIGTTHRGSYLIDQSLGR